MITNLFISVRHALLRLEQSSLQHPTSTFLLIRWKSLACACLNSKKKYFPKNISATNTKHTFTTQSWPSMRNDISSKLIHAAVGKYPIDPVIHVLCIFHWKQVYFFGIYTKKLWYILAILYSQTWLLQLVKISTSYPTNKNHVISRDKSRD